MTLTDYTFILIKPDAINNRQTAALEKIVEEFPYFQSARALRLKGLYNEDSFKYNYALKVSAAHTTDRSVLFDFITSDSFTSIHKQLYDEKIAALHNIPVMASEVVEPQVHQPKPVALNSLEQSILTSINESQPPPSAAPQENELLPPQETEQQPEQPVMADRDSETLEIGKPLPFEKGEKHSFEEWLQLSRLKPIQREAEATPGKISVNVKVDEVKQKKNELIDRFIEANPKIPPIRPDHSTSPSIALSETDHSYLMTETLARVYLEQKKYSKAIQAYEILILKYPEKSSFFADRILDIKHLQQNNNIK